MRLNFPLRDDVAHHVAMNIRQPEVATRGAEGEFFVIEAEQMHDRGVKVMHVDFVLGCGKAKLVRGTMNVAAFHAATRHPHAEAVMIVVAAINLAGI